MTAIKSKLTSLANATREVSTALDSLRQGVLDCVVGIEEAIAGTDNNPVADPGVPAGPKFKRSQVG